MLLEKYSQKARYWVGWAGLSLGKIMRSICAFGNQNFQPERPPRSDFLFGKWELPLSSRVSCKDDPEREQGGLHLFHERRRQTQHNFEALSRIKSQTTVKFRPGFKKWMQRIPGPLTGLSLVQKATQESCPEDDRRIRSKSGDAQIPSC